MISKSSKAFLFLGLCFALILTFFPFQEDKLVFRRLEHDLRRFEKASRAQLQENCRVLTPKVTTTLSHLLVRRLAANLGTTANTACQLEVDEAAVSRFSLITRKEVLVTVFHEGTQKTITQDHFSVSYPRPLAFLPLLLFFVSLLLGKTVWGLGLTFTTYFLMLFNFNVIETISRTYALAELVVSTDKTWLGFTLLTFFLLLARQEFNQKKFHRKKLTPPENVLNRGILGAVGMWNPAFFTHFFTLFFRGHSIKRLYYYFDAQMLMAVLSLYLLSLKDKFNLEGLRQSIFLPRYFTFALCLGLFVTYGGSRTIKKIPLWYLPGLRRHLLTVAIIEGIALFWKPLTIFPTLTRVSFALLLSQLTLSTEIKTRQFFKDASQPLAWIFLSALVSMASIELGVLDLALTIFEPQAHPSVLTFFTYLSGIFIGILTGNFSTTFFALVPSILKSQGNPIVRAALLDGIVAGSLLSPFSLFTLLPVAMLKVPLHEVLNQRLKQLAIPLLVGGAVYALSAVNSVAILRPVTFIFLCILVIVIKLHRNEWKMTRVWPWEVHLPKLDRSNP